MTNRFSIIPVGLIALFLVSNMSIRASESLAPPEVLQENLETLLRSGTLPAIYLPDSAATFVGITGEMQDNFLNILAAAWNKQLHNMGYTVFLQPQSETYELQVSIHKYSFRISAVKAGIFRREIYDSLEFLLEGEATLISPERQILTSDSFRVSKRYPLTNGAGEWIQPGAGERYPIRVDSFSERPEVRTVLLAITSSVIIYLFYNLRG